MCRKNSEWYWTDLNPCTCHALKFECRFDRWSYLWNFSKTFFLSFFQLWAGTFFFFFLFWAGTLVQLLLNCDIHLNRYTSFGPTHWAYSVGLAQVPVLIIANRTKFSLLLCQRKVFFFFSIIHLLYWISSLLLHGDLFFWVQLYKIGSYMICCWVKKKRIYYSIRLCSFLYQYIWTLTSLVFCGNMKNTFLHSQAKEFSNLSGWCLAGWMIVVFLQLI